MKDFDEAIGLQQNVKSSLGEEKVALTAYIEEERLYKHVCSLSIR